MSEVEPVAPPGDDRLAEVHEQLAAAVERLVTGEDWAQMLAVTARFHDYSLNNCLLIATQCAARGIEPRAVAGYRAWQALGHQVRRGEHGLTILAPVLRRAPERDGVEPSSDGAPPESAGPVADGGGRAVHQVLVGFRVTKVFELSQTDGPPLPEVAPETLAGEAPAALYDGLATQVAAAGFTLLREDCSPAFGRTDFLRRSVAVRPDLPPAQAAKTLAHELAHVRLHDGERFRALGAFSCRGLAEVEAESVAYLVCATAGLETGGYSFPYVARWAGGDVGLVRSAAERSLGAARAITGPLGLTGAARDLASEAVLARSRGRDKADEPIPAPRPERPMARGPMTRGR